MADITQTGLSLGEQIVLLVRLLEHQQLNAYASSECLFLLRLHSIYSTRLTVVGATVFYLWDMSEWLLDTAWFLKTNRLDSPVHKWRGIFRRICPVWGSSWRIVCLIGHLYLGMCHLRSTKNFPEHMSVMQWSRVSTVKIFYFLVSGDITNFGYTINVSFYVGAF